MFMRVTLALIAINVVVFIVQGIFAGFTEFFALTPALAMRGAYWQFFTYMFLHGGMMHIFLNMFILLIFGVMVERELGWDRYLILYIISGLGSAGLYLILTGESMILMLGASGAIFAVLTAYGIMFPKNIIFVPPGIPMPAMFAVVFFVAIELFFGLTGLEPGIANFGHLGGIVTGAALMFYWKRFARRRRAQEFRSYEFIWE
jgi:membrane associated rhomboid family serine protease